MATKPIRVTRPDRSLGTVDAYVSQRLRTPEGNQGGGPPLKGGTTTPLSPDSSPQKINVESILGLVAQLSIRERKQLLARLSLDDGLATVEASARDIDMWAGAVYKALVDVLGAGGEGLPGSALVKRSLSDPASWSHVQEFMTTAKLNVLKVTERQQAYNVLARLVVGNARSIASRRGIPLSARLVAGIQHNVAHIFDAAFPGYVASGLAWIVVKSTGEMPVG